MSAPTKRSLAVFMLVCLCMTIAWGKEKTPKQKNKQKPAMVLEISKKVDAINNSLASATLVRRQTGSDEPFRFLSGWFVQPNRVKVVEPYANYDNERSELFYENGKLICLIMYRYTTERERLVDIRCCFQDGKRIHTENAQDVYEEEITTQASDSTLYLALVSEILQKLPKGGRIPRTWLASEPVSLAENIVRLINSDSWSELEKVIAYENNFLNSPQSGTRICTVASILDTIRTHRIPGKVTWSNKDECLKELEQKNITLSIRLDGIKPWEAGATEVRVRLHKTPRGWEWRGIECKPPEPADGDVLPDEDGLMTEPPQH